MPASSVKAPLNIRDFTGGRGSYHSLFCGVSGSGKTSAFSYVLASQFRNLNQGHIIVDPQGQFSSETEAGLPFSLRGFAEELGREVIVRRISEDLQLPKDAPLFGELLAKTKFATNIMKMSGEVQELLLDEMVKALKGVDDWESTAPEVVFDTLLRKLRTPNVLRLVYADNNKKVRLMVALSEILGEDPVETIDGDHIDDLSLPEFRDYRRNDDGVERRKSALSSFVPLHNLFAPTNHAGAPRHGLWGTISRVFDKQGRGANPAPVLILDMSANTDASWVSSILADEDVQAATEALRVLDQDAIKAAILNQIVDTLDRTAQAAFKAGETLNVQCVLDESYRFAPPPNLASTPEQKELTQRLGQAARDMRKYGVGWTYITQTTRSINPDIWDQITVRYVGYGLAGADIEKVAEQLDDRSHLQLYKGFAPPESTGKYPWMILGPVSPLSFSRAPVLVDIYTDFDTFRDDNRHWIEPIRLSMGLSVLSGPPARPTSSGLTLPARSARPTRTVSAPPRGARAADQIERVRANRHTGGVDPAAGTGLGSDPTFGSGLDFIDDDQPPF